MKYGFFVLSALLFSACTFTKKTEVSSWPNQAHPAMLPTPENDTASYAEFVNDHHASATELRTPANNGALTLPTGYKPGAIFSLIKEPSLLQALESSGLHFQFHLGLNGSAEATTRQLTDASPFYKSMTQTLKDDLTELLAEERKARGEKAVGVGMAYNVRVFDSRWFESPKASFQLIGVINRLDRVAFNPETCGELRFVYRMGYEDPKSGIHSRLPFTLLVKYVVPGKAHPHSEWELCKRMVRSWTYPDSALAAKDLANWLTSPQGPLDGGFLNPANLHSYEINFQALRIPSTIRPEFGGHGNYLMRVFKKDGDKATPVLLENTPDVNKILADSALHAELKQLMKDRHVVNRIDNGIWMMPEKFAAYRAYSFSPMGLDRMDNRLFHKLLNENDFNPEHFRQVPKFVFTPGAAIKRLNDLSCVGCHQGRATAGFHFLGIDRKETHDFNSLQFEGSGHFQIEQQRRARYLGRVAKNLVPDPGRDFSFAPPNGGKAGYGDFCGLNGSKSFSHWKCNTGLECIKVDGVPGENELGKCFPKPLTAGSACTTGVVSQANHRADKLTEIKDLKCGTAAKAYRCSLIKGGFPSGMCGTNCTGLNAKSEICAHIAGAGFTDCLAKGKPFEKCLDGSGKSGRGLCDENISCRNDYVCSRTFGGKGNCTPSYFMFQIRLDGHPSPI